MAFPWEPPRYSPKGLETQYINSVHQSHESICGCSEPILHLLRIYNERSSTKKPLREEELKDIKWRLTGEGGHGDPPNIVGEDGLDSFDLEQLFADDGDGAGAGEGDGR